MKYLQSGFCSHAGWIFIEVPPRSVFNAVVTSVRVSGVSGHLGEPIPAPAGLARVELRAQGSFQSSLIASQLTLDVWIVEQKTTQVSLDFLRVR
jgi:hypothetical protein